MTRLNFAILLSCVSPLVLSSVSLEADEAASASTELSIVAAEEIIEDDSTDATSEGLNNLVIDAATDGTTEGTTESTTETVTEAVTEAFAPNFPDNINFGAWSISYSFPNDHNFSVESVDDFDMQLQTMLHSYTEMMIGVMNETERFMKAHPESNASVEVEKQLRYQAKRLRAFGRSMRSTSTRMGDVDNAIMAFKQWSSTLYRTAAEVEAMANRLSHINPGLQLTDVKLPSWRFSYSFPRDKIFSNALIEEFDVSIQTLSDDILPEVQNIVRSLIKDNSATEITTAHRLILEDVARLREISQGLMSKISFFEHRESASRALTCWAATLERLISRLVVEADRLNDVV